VNLVTGSTGILGSHVLLELLLDGKPVLAGKQSNSNIQKVKQLFSYYIADYEELFDKIKWVDIDVRDIFSIENALEDITTVYHCAGFVSFDKKDSKKLMEINDQGTANVVNACLNKNIDALCHVSSIAAINNLDYELPLHEGVFWKTSGKESDYAISKYNGEREVWRGIEEGLNAVIVNPGIIFSPGFWNQSSSRIFETCYHGNKYYTSGTTGYVSARDLARIMIELIQQRKFRNRYIVIENNYNYKTIFSLVQSGLKKPLPSINVSRRTLWIVYFFASIISRVTGKSLQVTKAIVNAAFNKQKFSNQKVKEALNFDFTPIDQLISQICKHYLIEKSI
jgi:nucleoside-diphosphate-sugar epimerase